MSFISLDGVAFAYPGSSRPALEELSFTIEKGEYVALVGRNGSGKSTLIRLLDGLRKPTAGRLEVLGLDSAVDANARSLRSAVALVFQTPLDQIVSSVVEEDVAFGPENLGLTRAEIEARVSAALEAVGLLGLRKRPSLFLSAGQQQRLAIAGALAMDPVCIAFDEATAMLDPEARAELLALIDGLVARGITVVHATHDMAEAARAGRLLVLEAGRLVFDGSPARFFARGEGASAPPALAFGLDLPPPVRIALGLGLAPRASEEAASLAARILAAPPSMKGGAAGLDLAEPAGRDGAARVAEAAGRVGEAGDAEAAGRVGEARDAETARAAPTGRATTAGAIAPAFRAEGLSFTWLKGTANQVVALKELSLSIPAGSTLALVGRTGSGKSSLLQLLDGLAQPTAGRVSAFGLDTQARSTNLRALRMRAPLSIQRPETALFEVYAGDDVAFGPRNAGLTGKALVERVRASMDRVGLPFESFRDRGTRALSGGEKRKLALAGVLALEPEALLLDEPTSALDPVTKAAVMLLIEGFAAAGGTVVLATHSMEEAARADLVCVIREGEIVALAPPRGLFYELYDPGWGLARPYAAQVAAELARGGLELESRPLGVDELLTALEARRAAAEPHRGGDAPASRRGDAARGEVA